MNTNVTLKTNTDLIAFLTGIFKPHATALQGIMDRVPDALKPEFKRLKDEMDSAIAKLGPIDAAPAALDAGFALQSLSSAVERVQEYATAVTTKLADLVRMVSEKATALQGFEDKVKAGDLLTKAAATDLVTTARTEERNAFKPQILAMRKQQIELAGLPMPADAVLELNEAEYAPRFESAKTNVKNLGERGFKVGGRGAGLIKDLAWLPATEFAGKLTSYEDVLGKGAPAGDPLLGNPGTPPANDKPGRSRMW